MRTRAALLAVALIAGAPLLQAGPAEAEGFYQRGLKLERARSYASAAAFYDAAISADASFAPAVKEIGNCHFYLGDKEQAYKDYQAYLLLRPDDQVIVALAAKLAPPTPVPTPGMLIQPVNAKAPPFFQEPGWQSNVALDAERAHGKFQVTAEKALNTASNVIAVYGHGPAMQEPEKGRVYSDPFLINLGLVLGRGEFPGNNPVYCLQAAIEDHQTFVQVRWRLYWIYAPPQPEILRAGSMEPPMPGPPPTEAESGQNDEIVLNEGRQRFTEKGLPEKPVELSPAVDEKLQRDWNWRLWSQWTEPKTEKGPAKILVKGWSTDRNYRFNLYMSEVPGRGYRKMNDKPIEKDSFLVENLVQGKAYYFVMTMVTRDEVESRPAPEWEMVASADGK